MLSILKQEGTLVKLLLSLLFLLFSMLAIFSEATFDSGDGIRHYLIARYSWNHPYLFLDSWGKPFYVLISSPFAQFGLIGATLFNILCGIGTAFYTFKICKKLNLVNAWLAIPFLLFAPIYFPSLNSSLTEPFFGFVLMLSIYGYMNKKYIIHSLLISFLPFIRTEGFLLLPLFFLILIYRKQYVKTLLLGVGTFIYSFIGFIYLNDVLWIKNQNPYNGVNKEFYGHGELLHFIYNFRSIWGIPLIILLLSGIIAFCIHIYKLKQDNKSTNESNLFEELILINGAFCVYFIAHSLMWWKGWANSLGMLRVLAAVIPCNVVLMLRGLNLFMFKPLVKHMFIKALVILTVLFFVIINAFKQNYFPYKYGHEEKLVSEAGKWLKSTNYLNKKIYYLYPSLAQVLNLDSFDPNKMADLWGLYERIEKLGYASIPDSTIVFWDAHFGPNECRIPLAKIIQDENFKLIKSFAPQEKYTTLGGQSFEVYIFMKLPYTKGLDVLNKLHFNFENKSDIVPNGIIDSTISYSGEKCLQIKSSNVYSAGINMNIDDIPLNTLQCKMTARIFNPNQDSLKLISVFAVGDNNNINLKWDGKNVTIAQSADNNQWYLVESTSNVVASAYYAKSNKFDFYFWNINNKKYYVDDLEIQFIGKD
ncbi:MAG TPA: hypothetical protein PK323_03840 [Bacteroidia bacterium]|nr:hypothetical protein [Bacteroidia bacterium]